MLRDPLNKKSDHFRFKPKRSDRLDRGFSNAYMNPISTFRGKPAFKSSKYVRPQFSRGGRTKYKSSGYTFSRKKKQAIFSQRSYGGLVSIALVAIVIAIGLFVGWRISLLPNAIGVAPSQTATLQQRSNAYPNYMPAYTSGTVGQLSGGDASLILAPPAQPLEYTGDVDRLLMVVNASNPLPDGLSVQRSTIEYDVYMSSSAAQSAMTMIANMQVAGMDPKVLSAYRSYDTQETLYESQGSDPALVEAPDYSEHQTGLALDIVSGTVSLPSGLSTGYANVIADTPEQQWLFKHAHEYGFILRYPADKVAITGVAYEPWHFRYVGKDAAAEIVSSGMCLEEYVAAI